MIHLWDTTGKQHDYQAATNFTVVANGALVLSHGENNVIACFAAGMWQRFEPEDTPPELNVVQLPVAGLITPAPLPTELLVP